MQREVGVLLPLSLEAITDPAAKYNAVYHQARALEMAESAAKYHGSGMQAAVAIAVAAAMKGRGGKRPPGGGGGDKGAGSKDAGDKIDDVNKVSNKKRP